MFHRHIQLSHTSISKFKNTRPEQQTRLVRLNDIGRTIHL